MKRTALLVLALILAFVFAPELVQAQQEKGEAQPKTNIEVNKEFLEQFAKDKYKQEIKRRRKVKRYAKRNGIPMRKETENGVIKLRFIDQNGHPVYEGDDNDDAATSISTDEVYSGGSAGLSLSGNGFTLRMWEAGGMPRNTHDELQGKTTNVDVNSISSHATHVAGTMMARGFVARSKGMAFDASLRAFDASFDDSEMASEAVAGQLISNHSYSFIRGWRQGTWYGDPAISTQEDYMFGFYSWSSRDWDQIAFNAPYYLIFKSAGNDRGESGTGYPADGPYDCISDRGICKNIMTVGAVNDVIGGYSGPSSVTMSSFSSWGPADDGRIKPDVVANGVGVYSCDEANDSDYGIKSGTSMSCPSASGSAALLQEHYEDLNGNGTFMRASTLKGLIIHTADECGSFDGPDYEFGWGLMNTQTATEVITADVGNNLITERTLNNGGTYTQNITALGGGTPLKVSITWTDPAGTPTSAQLDPITPMLVNDLDLRLSRSGTTYYPWKLDRNNPSNAATNNSENNVDNVEVVFIANPVAGGQYTITIDHDGFLTNGSQNYSLIITGSTIAVNDIIYEDNNVLDGAGGQGSGNNNGLAEPGEQIDLPVELRNTSGVTQTNVLATLSTADPDITITDNTESYGNIAIGSTAWSIDDYDFTVAANAPDKDVNFTLNISSNQGSWTEQFVVHIYGPTELAYEDQNVMDGGGFGQGNGDGDGLAEPGEEIDLEVELRNNSSITHTNIYAILSTADPDVTITDNYETWQNMTPGSTRWCDADYDFDISNNAPDKMVLFTLTITSDQGSWTDTFSMRIYGPVPLVYDGQTVMDGGAFGQGLGDGDGLAEPGEEIDLQVRLRNPGSVTHTNVFAFLSTNDPDVTITDGYETWQNIGSGGSLWCDADYDFTVDPNAAPQFVEFYLDVYSDQGTYRDTFDVQIHTQCNYSLSSNSSSVGAGSGGGNFNMVAPGGCAWTATESCSWLSITFGASGNGSGLIAYAFQANPSTSARSCTITVAGETFVVTQAGLSCTYTLSSNSVSLPSAAVGTSFTVTAPGSCAWTVSNPCPSWVTITAGSSGTGNGLVGYSLTANNSGTPRSCVLNVQGQTYTINQAAATCTYSLSSSGQSFNSNSNSGSFNVTTLNGCSWNTTYSCGWVSLISGATGNGNGTVGFTMSANPSTSSRSCVMTVGGQTYTITQAGAGCTYSLPNSTANVSGAGASGSLTVVTSPGCAWTVNNPCPTWITITSGATGTGVGTANYTVDPNPSTTPRSCVLTIQGQNYTINQAGQACNYALSISGQSYSATANAGSFNVIAPTGCSWTTSYSCGWVSLSAGASGNGNGTVSYTMTANGSVSSRSCAMTVGGQTYTITQAGIGCTYSISSGSNSVGSNGGNNIVAITAPPGCGWKVNNPCPGMITITSADSGTGNGSFSYNVSANTLTNTRVCTLNIQGNLHVVTQSGLTCTYGLSSVNQAFGETGGNYTFNVVTPAACGWTITNPCSSWLTITSPNTGSGNGSISYTVDPNPSSVARNCVISVQGVSHNVSQAGATCTYSLSAPGRNFASNAAGTGSVNVTSPTGCAWTTSNPCGWVTVTGGSSGTGNGSVTYSVAANLTTSARTCSLQIGGVDYVISQPGVVCSYSLNTNSQNFATSAAANGSFNILAGAPCSWSITNPCAWVTINSATSGTGNATVSYSISANTGTSQRSCTLVVNGNNYTITQAGLSCSYSLNSNLETYPAVGGAFNIAVTAAAACSWSTTNNCPSWVTISGATSGTGNGTVSYTVAANSSSVARSCSLNIQGQVHAINQDGATCTYGLSSSGQTFNDLAASDSFDLITPGGCVWTVSNPCAWVTLNSASAGSDSATVSYSISENLTTSTRTCTLTAGGLDYVIEQAGKVCDFSLDNSGLSFGGAGGTGSFGLSPLAICNWTATESCSWVVFSSAFFGSGPATISYTVDQNLTGSTRTCVIDLNGETHTITQSSIDCSVTLSSSSDIYNANQQTGSVDVTAHPACSWTMDGNNCSFVTITNNGTGTGNATVEYLVEENLSPNNRSCTFTIEGLLYRITQQGAVNTSIGEPNVLDAIEIYPNPTQGSVYVKLPDASITYEVALYNTLGQLIKSESMAGDQTVEYGLEGDAGVYYLYISAGEGDGKVIKKVVKL